jgi:hypothetical protein
MVCTPDGLVLFVAEKTAFALAGYGHRRTITATRTFRSARPADASRRREGFRRRAPTSIIAPIRCGDAVEPPSPARRARKIRCGLFRT